VVVVVDVIMHARFQGIKAVGRWKVEIGFYPVSAGSFKKYL